MCKALVIFNLFLLYVLVFCCNNESFTITANDSYFNTFTEGSFGNLVSDLQQRDTIPAIKNLI